VKPELEAAIRAVEAPANRAGPPTRHEARPILLGIGRSLQTGRPEELGDAADRLRGLPERPRKAWIAAVKDEIAMAITEYVRCVDPRFLDHPQYDLDYTLEARRQLDARLKACEYLGEPAEPAAVDAVARADALLSSRKRIRIQEWLEKQAMEDGE
jgi:hypothetical protein